MIHVVKKLSPTLNVTGFEQIQHEGSKQGQNTETRLFHLFMNKTEKANQHNMQQLNKGGETSAQAEKEHNFLNKRNNEIDFLVYHLSTADSGHEIQPARTQTRLIGNDK